MLIAGSLDLSALLASLTAQRPVFHSEADFQHSLAWTARTMAPNLQVRLESQPEPSLHLDLLITRRDSDAATAIELKYLTHAWEARCKGESASNSFGGYTKVNKGNGNFTMKNTGGGK